MYADPIKVNANLVGKRNINQVIEMYETVLKWDPQRYQHDVKLILSPKYQELEHLWLGEDFCSWMKKIIIEKPEMIFFLENNEFGVDLALACIGLIVNKTDARTPLINNIQINPKMKNYLVQSLEEFVQLHEIPISSTHELYMKILSVPNTPYAKEEIYV